MTLNEKTLGLVVVALVGAAVVVAIVIACLREDLADTRARAREARDAVDALIELDPSLLATFGRALTWGDRDGVGARGTRTLDVDRLLRLAKTRHSLTQRAERRTELDEALAALSAARKDNE